jgi:PAS domain S-box-containing protein
MPVMVWMANANNESVHANRAYLDFTGRPLEAELGSGWTELVHPDDLEHCQAIYLPAFERRQPFQMEYRLRRHDGEYRWVLVIGVPRFTPDGSFVGYIGSAMDVTVHKLAEAALSGLTRKLMEAHEGERALIARDLHDDVGQRLVGLTMQLHSLSHLLSNEASDARVRIQDVCGQASDLVRDLQALSHQLHSSRLDHLGLAAAIAGLCEELSTQRGIEIGFWDEGVPEDLPKEVAICLFRVVQETLNNALKHSGARHVSVNLRGGIEDIQVEVIDNGIGFDPEAAIRNRGLGLISIQERLGLVEGSVLFDSRPGAGTRILACVPLRRMVLAGAVVAPSTPPPALQGDKARPARAKS